METVIMGSVTRVPRRLRRPVEEKQRVVEYARRACIRAYRETARSYGDTYSSLATASGCAWSTCRNWLDGRTQHPRLETVAAIAAALGVIEAEDVFLLPRAVSSVPRKRGRKRA